MKLEQMGPRRTRVLNKELNIESLEDLKKATEKGEIEKLEGFGKKISNNILKEIKEYEKKWGLDEKEFAGQIEEINKLNQKLMNIRILKSVKVDILVD